MDRQRPPLVKDRSVELALGTGLFVLATWLIYDAYEGRGRKRPFLARFLPG